MTPATIIQKAQADGVTLVLSPSGTIKAVGDREAVNRWVPIIREHKDGLLNELRAASDGAYDALPDAAAEARRQINRLFGIDIWYFSPFATSGTRRPRPYDALSPLSASVGR